jgi:hypothetical protein
VAIPQPIAFGDPPYEAGVGSTDAERTAHMTGALAANRMLLLYVVTDGNLPTLQQSLRHLSESTRRTERSRMPSSA